MTDPVVYAKISGVSREPMYGNIGEHKRQAAGKQHTKMFLYYGHFFISQFKIIEISQMTAI